MLKFKNRYLKRFWKVLLINIVGDIVLWDVFYVGVKFLILLIMKLEFKLGFL